MLCGGHAVPAQGFEKRGSIDRTICYAVILAIINRLGLMRAGHFWPPGRSDESGQFGPIFRAISNPLSQEPPQRLRYPFLPPLLPRPQRHRRLARLEPERRATPSPRTATRSSQGASASGDPASQRAVDRDPARTPGRFVPTGSANSLMLERIGETLAGRAVYVTLWPFARRERWGLGQASCWPRRSPPGARCWSPARDRRKTGARRCGAAVCPCPRAS